MTTLCNVPEFWLANKDMVYGYIKKNTNDNDLAKDLTQEVLLKVYRFCEKQCGVKNKRAWLFDIAHNTIIDYYRKQKADSTLDCDKYDLQEEKYTDIYQDISIFIRPLLTCLPEIYVEPLRLELDGIDQKEIARRLNLNLSTVKSRIQRSKSLIKDLLFECFHLELSEEGKIDSFQPKSDCKAIQHFLNENTF